MDGACNEAIPDLVVHTCPRHTRALHPAAQGCFVYTVQAHGDTDIDQNSLCP